jgi:hypothetical protein
MIAMDPQPGVPSLAIPFDVLQSQAPEHGRGVGFGRRFAPIDLRAKHPDPVLIQLELAVSDRAVLQIVESWSEILN